MLSGHTSSWIGIAPLHRARSLVVLADVAEDLAGKVPHRIEDAAVDQVALDLGEPQLHLIEPRAVGRREVESDVWILLEKLLNPRRLVGTEVVENDVNLPI